MKTNQMMISPDRNLMGQVIRVSTDGMMSVTDLALAYEKARIENGWTVRYIHDILSNRTTHERLYYLLKEEGLIETGFPVFMEKMNISNVAELKRLGVYKTTGRGDNRQVVCSPYIWMLLAMELNPQMYAKVVHWFTDSLLFDRMEAGDKFKPMNDAISIIIAKPEYYIYAMEINKMVFGQHMTGIRNLASSKQLKHVASIEQAVKDSIKLGFVKTHEDILKVIHNYRLEN